MSASYQNSAMKGDPLIGKMSGMKAVFGVRNERSPLVLTYCQGGKSVSIAVGNVQDTKIAYTMSSGS